MKNTIEIKIKNCKTLKEYLDVIQENFDCENCKPGIFTKTILIETIRAKVSANNSLKIDKMKIKAQQAKNLKEFIEIVQANFDTNQAFTENAKLFLVDDTNKLLLLTQVKENKEIHLN